MRKYSNNKFNHSKYWNWIISILLERREKSTLLQKAKSCVYIFKHHCSLVKPPPKRIFLNYSIKIYLLKPHFKKAPYKQHHLTLTISSPHPSARNRDHNKHKWLRLLTRQRVELHIKRFNRVHVKNHQCWLITVPVRA